MNMTSISLRTLLDRLPPAWGTLALRGADADAVSIASVTEDSRKVGPGTLFLARRGRGSDGHRYIPAALAAGAVAVVGELPLAKLPAPLPVGFPYLQVNDGRTA